MRELNRTAVRHAMSVYGHTNADLAKLVGVTTNCVYRILRGTRQPGREFIVGLMDAYPAF